MKIFQQEFFGESTQIYPSTEPKTEVEAEARGAAGAPDLLELWQDMPEFVQEKKEPYAKIIFRFEDEESLQEFAQLIGQKLTRKTKSSWHPFKPHKRTGGRKVYVDGN